MAYVLGFWFADGYMRKEKSYRVVFSSRDKDILLQIRHSLNSNHPLREYFHKKGKSWVWQLNFCSRHLYEGLLLRGGMRCKSHLIGFPNIPRNFLPDFIRGYFDGDGSVFYVNYISTKNHKPRRELRSNFTSGSRQFLESLMNILCKKLALSIKKLGSYNRGGSLKLGYGTKDTKRLLEFIYYQSFPIGLQRKAKFAE